MDRNIIKLENIKERVIMLKLSNKGNYKKMNDFQLYERIRGHWKIKTQYYKNNPFDLVFAMKGRQVIGIYEPAGWFTANSTMYLCKKNLKSRKKLFEFVGKVANRKYLNKYLYKSIIDLKGFRKIKYLL